MTFLQPKDNVTTSAYQVEAEHQPVNHETDQTRDHSPNPYAAPVSQSASATRDEQPILPPPKPGRVIIKWLMVCGIAAGPSFYFGGGLGGWRTPETLGMVFGILIFVAGYSAIEFMPQIQSAMAQRVKRRATRVAYITRMGISILFPIGVLVDLYCGIVSVMIASAITGSENPLGSRGSGFVLPPFRFSIYLLTTLIQGTLLNILVFTYMMIVYGFLRMIGMSDSHSGNRKDLDLHEESVD